MTIVEKIVERLKSMPESAQAEVLDFIEHIKLKKNRSGDRDEWSQFSLDSAMRGIKEEASPYRIEDIREKIE